MPSLGTGAQPKRRPALAVEAVKYNRWLAETVLSSKGEKRRRIKHGKLCK